MIHVRSFLTLLLFAFYTGPTLAANDWWFDVEVIVFDRNVALTELAEQFEEIDDLAPYEADWDLISANLLPDISWLKQGLPTCDTGSSPLWLAEPSLDSIIRDYEAWQSGQVDSVIQRSDDLTEAAKAIRFSTRTEQQGAAAATDVTSTLKNEDTDSTSALGLSPQPLTRQQIAGYWVAFSGISDTKPVAVPRFRYCELQTPWLNWQDGQWRRFKPDNHLPYPDHLPITPNGQDWAAASRPHLLSADQRKLTKLSQQIKQAAGLNRLLHVVWRQPVKFSEEKAASVRLFAGKNYADTFTLTGERIKQAEADTAPLNQPHTGDGATLTDPQDNFFPALYNKLNQAAAVSFPTMMAAVARSKNQPTVDEIQTAVRRDIPIWQLDGELKVYLKYINRVPYLHIDSELAYRQPVPIEDANLLPSQAPTYRLVSVPFNQVRRVISKQLHYFDHPLFGMVVEIRRYTRPGEQE